MSPRSPGPRPSSQRPIQPPPIRSGALGELKRLLYQLYLGAGRPTLDRMVELVAEDDDLTGAPLRDTVSQVIGAPDLPPQQADTLAVALALAREARWSAPEIRATVLDLWTRARLTTVPGRPVREHIDPFALEVHRAVELPAEPDGDGVPLLPAYVVRAHDRELARIVRTAEKGRSALTVLVGSSYTGKTRACWEAVQRLPARWRLWHPIEPDGPEAVRDALGQVDAHTVIWLNDSQLYIGAQAGPLGEHVAAGLRALLHDPGRGPVLVLGTLWPEYWTALTTVPPPERLTDEHSQARALLTGHDLRVPDVFGETDLRALRALAAEDRRLAWAHERVKDGHVTQYLAGAPALLERYRTARPAVRALIEAAVDARRLGHGPHLPRALLAAAAPGYLTDQQYDLLPDDWLDHALAFAAEPVRGTPGALATVRPRSDRVLPPQPHYRLADFLEQYGREERQVARVPEPLWHALAEFAARSELRALARSAADRGLVGTAARLLTAAAAEEPEAAVDLARLLRDAGHTEAALAWYAYVAGDRVNGDAGTGPDAEAVNEAAELLEREGRIDEAVGRLRPACRSGRVSACWLTAAILLRAGRTDEAGQALATAVAAEGPASLLTAAGMLAEADLLDEALPWYDRAAEDGSTAAAIRAADLLRAAGRSEEALDRYLRALDLGDTTAAHPAATLLHRMGRTEDALSRYRQALDLGDSTAAGPAAGLLHAAGRSEEALTLLRPLVVASDQAALKRAVDLLRAIGRTDEALDLLHRSSASDGSATGDRRRAAWLLEEIGRVDEAVAALGLAGGPEGVEDPFALLHGAEVLRRAGRDDEALTLLRRAGAVSGEGSHRQEAAWLEELGRVDEALELLRHARGSDGAADLEALRLGAEMLDFAGRADEALEWYDRAGADGDVEALLSGGQLSEKAGRFTEAADRFGRAAGLGHPDAGWHRARMLMAAGRTEAAVDALTTDTGSGPADRWRAAELLQSAGRLREALAVLAPTDREPTAEELGLQALCLGRAGRVEEAVECYRRAGEAGEAGALGQACEALRTAGRDAEAERLRRYGWEPGGGVAAAWAAPLPARPGQQSSSSS
ncbi:tetratricopeptide repeat protein [Kitasatospora sp. NPDC047058]|uniref:tetratricopeptide repeat protein n=1 Tax=Kitasatospora sp. NPDC047058 TaxID=3155620 RepID=UPI0033D5F7C0